MDFTINIKGRIDDPELLRNTAVRMGLTPAQAESPATCLEYLTIEPDCAGITLETTAVEVSTPKES